MALLQSFSKPIEITWHLAHSQFPTRILSPILFKHLSRLLQPHSKVALVMLQYQLQPYWDPFPRSGTGPKTRLLPALISANHNLIVGSRPGSSGPVILLPAPLSHFLCNRSLVSVCFAHHWSDWLNPSMGATSPLPPSKPRFISTQSPSNLSSWCRQLPDPCFYLKFSRTN